MVIYKATNKINGKVYIGKWMGTRVAQRWAQHKSLARRGSDTYFHRAIRKHGEEAFEFELIYKAITSTDLEQAEIRFITLYGSHTRMLGYNLTLGGDGGIKTEATRLRMGQSKLGNQNAKGKKHRIHSRRGIEFSAQHLENLGTSQKRRMSTPEGKEHAKRMAAARWSR
jgi:group I intron endonuclease